MIVAEPAAAAAVLTDEGELRTPPAETPAEECCGRTIELVDQTTGQLIRSLCKATNKCPRCQRRYVRETVEMLLLDAAEWAPTHWSVLTAREHLTRAEFNEHLRVIRRRLVKRWPAWQYFVQVEFQRRGALHANLLHKGVPGAEFDAFQAELVRHWCRRVDAEPVGQYGDTIGDAAEVAKYLAKTLGHGLKAEQAPPLGWKGHRTSQSRGYFVRPAGTMRQEARESLRLKQAIAAAERAGHAPGLDAETAAALDLAEQQLRSWIPLEQARRELNAARYGRRQLAARDPLDALVDRYARLLAEGAP